MIQYNIRTWLVEYLLVYYYARRFPQSLLYVYSSWGDFFRNGLIVFLLSGQSIILLRVWDFRESNFSIQKRRPKKGGIVVCICCGGLEFLTLMGMAKNGFLAIVVSFANLSKDWTTFVFANRGSSFRTSTGLRLIYLKFLGREARVKILSSTNLNLSFLGVCFSSVSLLSYSSVHCPISSMAGFPEIHLKKDPVVKVVAARV